MTSASIAAARRVGEQVRGWRRHRRLSQLACALEMDISQRHLSFIESGRAKPSREMLRRIADCLEVPLRERNPMWLAAGYAPDYHEHSLDDPQLAPARAAIDLLLKAHEPFPALAIDRHWNLLAANAAIAPLMALVQHAALLAPPVNVLRLSLHEGGLAPHIRNLPQWRAHLLERLRHDVQKTGDPALAELLMSLRTLSPEPSAGRGGDSMQDFGGVFVPLQLMTAAGELSFFSTTTVFGTPTDVTLSEIAIEAFFPADEQTAQRMPALMRGAGQDRN